MTPESQPSSVVAMWICRATVVNNPLAGYQTSTTVVAVVLVAEILTRLTVTGAIAIALVESVAMSVAQL